MRIGDRVKTKKFRDDKHKLIISIYYLCHKLKNSLNVMLKENNLSFEQFNVLRILKGSGEYGLNVKEIADRILEPNSNVPRIIDKLELKKFVERNISKVDKRVTIVTITQIGIALLEKIELEHIKVENKSLPLSETECKAINDILENSF
jgi:DNA-binding MarR family transcriptional regulator